MIVRLSRSLYFSRTINQLRVDLVFVRLSGLPLGNRSNNQSTAKENNNER